MKSHKVDPKPVLAILGGIVAHIRRVSASFAHASEVMDEVYDPHPHFVRERSALSKTHAVMVHLVDGFWNDMPEDSSGGLLRRIYMDLHPGNVRGKVQAWNRVFWRNS